MIDTRQASVVRSSLTWWIATGCLLLLGLTTLAQLMRMELGPRAAIATGGDEIHFATCAARALHTGQLIAAGCHDNKGPLVFAAHAAVQAVSGLYPITAIKWTAFALAGINVLLAAALALRIAGPLAAAATAAVATLSLSIDAHLLALKTEPLGMAFLLASLLCCADPRASALRWLAAGLLLGAATLSKQTFGFVLAALLIWCWIASGSELRRVFVVRAGALVAGVALPIAAATLWFSTQGRVVDFLASLLLYPAVYAADGPAPWLTRLRWTTGSVGTDMALAPLALAPFAYAAAVLPQQLRDGGPAAAAELLPLLAAVVLAALLVLAPKYFRFHLLPVWLLMAIVSGVVVGRAAAPGSPVGRGAARGIAAALVALGATMALSSWYTNGLRGNPLPEPEVAPSSLDVAPGAFAYMLGMWPQFYADHGFIPASDVQFPWALAGAPANWFYAPPRQGSLVARWLEPVQRRNVARLLDDFERTPPQVMAINEEMARAPGSQRISDVPGLDEYLQVHCIDAGVAPPRRQATYRLFLCGDARERARQRIAPAGQAAGAGAGQ